MKYSEVKFKTLACIAGRHERYGGFQQQRKMRVRLSPQMGIG